MFLECLTSIGLARLRVSFANTLAMLAISASSLGAQLQGIVVGEAHRPIAGATVQLVEDHQIYWSETDLKPVSAAKTKKDGAFAFDAPSSGTFALIASAEGHRRAKFPVNVAAAGQRTVGIALEPGIHLRGTVTDETGRPISGAKLGPLRASLDTPLDVAQRVIPEWVESDADGKFEFSAVLSGVNFTFLARKTGYEANNVQMSGGERETSFRLLRGGYNVSGSIYTRGMPESTYAGAAVRLNGNGFDMAARCGNASDFHIDGIPPGEYSCEPITDSGRQGRAMVLSFPRDHETSVGLEVASGYYITGTTVNAETSTVVGGVGLRYRDSITTSGQNGTFRLGALLVGGPVEVQVIESSGFRNAELETPTDFPTANGFDDVTGLIIRVRKQRTVHVTILNAERTTAPISLHLLAPSGKPRRIVTQTSTTVIGVYEPGDYVLYAQSGGAYASEATTISLKKTYDTAALLSLGDAAAVGGSALLSQSGDSASTRTKTATFRVLSSPLHKESILLSETQAPFGARFLFPTLPIGRFSIEAINQSGTQRQLQTIDLLPGSRQDLQFDFVSGNSFSGVVTNAEQQPVPAVEITYQLPSRKSGRTETADDGTFHIEDLQTSQITQVLVDHYNFLPFRAGPIELPQQNFAIVLQKAGLLRAKIEADPATHWKVFLMQSQPWGVGSYPEQWMSRPAAQADADGGETIETAMPGAGRYRFVAISRTNALAVSEPFELRQNETAPRNVTLNAGAVGSISGAVGTGNDNTAEVTAWNTALPEGRVGAEFKVQPVGGNYRIEGLPPGDYLLLAAGENVTASAVNVTLSPGENKRVDLAANPRLEISGQVVLNGAAASGAQVHLVSETDPSVKPQTTPCSANGEFRFKEMPADTYTVRATLGTAKGELATQRSVTASRGGRVPPITLDLTPPPLITLTLPDGTGITPGADVTLMNLETHSSVKAQWTGEVLQAALAPGKYEIWNGDVVAGTTTVSLDAGAVVQPAPKP
ncbi:MAG: carboxypeptidase regulatory-like domain-containing protein [Candidatus Sumerlaeaceae bacterium]